MNANTQNPMHIKYVTRRFVASIILAPSVAFANFILWAILIGLGAGDNGGFPGATWTLVFAWIVGFTFYPLVTRFFERIGL